MSTSSVIRILPRQKIERHTVPYAQVLSRALTTRALQASFVIFLAVLAWAPISSVLFPSNSVKGILLTFALSVFPVLLRTKLLLSAEAPVYASAAVEFERGLFSKQFAVTSACYFLSVFVFFKGAVSSSVALYTIQRAQFSERPQGIPANLPLHQTDQWYSIHQSYLYVYGFSYLVAFLASLYEGKRFVLDCDPKEVGMRPLRRVLNRLNKLKTTLILFIAVAALWPVVYIAGGRWLLFKYLTFGIWSTVELSHLQWLDLMLPVKLLPLVLLWTAGQEVLMSYLSVGPTRQGKPISCLAPSDWNGTLVNGMAREPGTLSARFAWWELLYIAEHLESRRKSIFADVDTDRVIWDEISAQIVALLTAHIGVLQKSTKELVKAPKNEQAAKEGALKEIHLSSTAEILKGHLSSEVDHDVFGDPKKVDVQPPTKTNLFKPQSALEKKLAGIVSRLETDSHARADSMRHKLSEWRKLLAQKYTQWLEWLLQTEVGHFFLHTVERKVGQLIQNRQTTALAMRGVARMITHSLKEDEHGYVQATVGKTLKLLDDYATLLEALIKTPPVDKLDVRVKQHEKAPDLSVARSMLSEVNSAFIEIAQEFEPYYENLGVNQKVVARTVRAKSGDLDVAERAWVL